MKSRHVGKDEVKYIYVDYSYIKMCVLFPFPVKMLKFVVNKALLKNTHTISPDVSQGTF